MRIVVLDGSALNPGDISRGGFSVLGMRVLAFDSQPNDTGCAIGTYVDLDTLPLDTAVENLSRWISGSPFNVVNA